MIIMGSIFPYYTILTALLAGVGAVEIAKHEMKKPDIKAEQKELMQKYINKHNQGK